MIYTKYLTAPIVALAVLGLAACDGKEEKTSGESSAEKSAPADVAAPQEPAAAKPASSGSSPNDGRYVDGP